MTDEEYFAYKCPYTDRPCYSWDCKNCEVEAEERRWMEEHREEVVDDANELQVHP